MRAWWTLSTTIAALAVAVAPAGATEVREVAVLPGGAELGMSGPAFAGPRVVVGWVDATQTAHVRAAGAATDLWSAAAPAPPPSPSPSDGSSRSVSQQLLALTASGEGVAASRRADLTVLPPCATATPACAIAVMPRPYRGELVTGGPRGPLRHRSGYGPSTRSDCPPRDAFDVPALAMSGARIASLLTPPPCFDTGGAVAPRIVLRTPDGRTLGTVRARSGWSIDAIALGGRWLAWLTHDARTAGRGPRTGATLLLRDLRRGRTRARVRLSVEGAQGPAAVRLAAQRDGRVALLLPGRDSGACAPGATLAWVSPGRPHLHHVRRGIAPSSPLALARGRALVELPRASDGSGCPEPGTVAAVPLDGGRATRLARFAGDEVATGGLAWDGRRAAFAAIVPHREADGAFTYGTSVRVTS